MKYDDFKVCMFSFRSTLCERESESQDATGCKVGEMDDRITAWIMPVYGLYIPPQETNGACTLTYTKVPLENGGWSQRDSVCAWPHSRLFHPTLDVLFFFKTTAQDLGKDINGVNGGGGLTWA